MFHGVGDEGGLVLKLDQVSLLSMIPLEWEWGCKHLPHCHLHCCAFVYYSPCKGCKALKAGLL